MCNKRLSKSRSEDNQVLRCTSSPCSSEDGVERSKIGTVWELMKCDSCGGNPVHIRCGNLDLHAPVAITQPSQIKYPGLDLHSPVTTPTFSDYVSKLGSAFPSNKPNLLRLRIQAWICIPQ